MPTNAQTKTRIANLLDGSGPYDSIDLDNDDEEVTAIVRGRQQTKLDNFQLKRTTQNPSATTRTRRVGQTSFEADEQRLMGQLPPDATPAPDPFRGVDEIAHRQKMPFANGKTGPFRPVNTLNNQPNSNTPFLQHKALERRYMSSSVTSKSPGSNSDVKVRSKDTEPPNKKRRTEEADRRSTKSPQMIRAVSQAQSRANEKSILAARYGMHKDELQSTPHRTNGVKRTPLRDLYTKCRRGSESPDDLMDVEEDPTQFTRDAKQKRLSSEGQADTSDARPKSYEQHAEQNNKASSTTPPRRNGAFSTPRRSKIKQRLQEQDGSPDVLQDSGGGPQRTSKLRPSPPSSIDYRLPPGDTFILRTFICPGVIAGAAFHVEVHSHNNSFSIFYNNEELSKDALISQIPLAKVYRLALPEDEDANILSLYLSAGSLPENRCYLEFESRKPLVGFHKLVMRLEPTIKTQNAASDWLRRAVAINYSHEQDASSNGRRPKKAASSTTNGSRDEVQQQIREQQPGNRRRRIDNLDAPPAQETKAQSIQAAHASQEESRQRSSRSQGAIYTDGLPQTRTRSTRQRDRAPSPSPVPINLNPRRDGPEWKKPLLYPRGGKRQESVSWDDLSRLEDGEFLNDSLVAFFLRYLQENSSPERVKSMHFFSTFFHETLTKGGRKPINYDGVKSWTKNINLFTRDYAIVPVNESYHWYAMIICNLRSLKKDDLDDGLGTDEVVELTESPEEHEPARDDQSKDILHSDVVCRDANMQDVRAEQEHDLNTIRKLPGRRKLAQRTPRKYALTQPIVMTLDSLDIPRSTTAGTLKDYLIREAQEKAQLEIDKSEIQGMTAKQIPLQGNYYDCGLYLCMYLEQFMANPSKFVRSILQGDTDAVKWPKRPKSDALRDRLYQLLQQLHQLQVSTDEEERQTLSRSLPPVGRILIRDEDFREPGWKPQLQEDITQDPERLRKGLKFVDKHYESEAEEKRRSRSASDRLVSAIPGARDASRHDQQDQEDQQEESPEEQNMILSEYFKQQREPIMIEDDSQHQFPIKDDTTSRHFDKARKPPQRRDIDDTPADLARRLKERRSPERHIQANGTTIDLTTPVQSQLHVHAEPNPAQDRERHRSISVNTDFLTGNRSYEPEINEDEGHQDQITGQSDAGSVFEGFDDHNRMLVDQGGHQKRSREGSFVPESVYGDQRGDDGNEPMLID